MKRVLVIVNNLGIGGGVQQVLYTLKNRLDNIIKFDYVCLSDEKLEEYNFSSDSNIFRIDEYYKRKYIGKINLYKLLKQKIKNYDYIYLNISSGSEVFIALMIKIIFGNKIIIHVHNQLECSYTKKILVSKISNFSADRLLACSIESAISYYGNEILKKDNFKIINNPIDIQKFMFNQIDRKVMRSKYNINENEVALGIIGRLERVKNHIFAIELMSDLVKNNNKYKLFIIGEGSMDKKIKDLIKRLDLHRNIVLLKTTKDINRIYNMIDILLMPSIKEGLGMTVVEGQYSGLKCIASEGVPKSTRISNNINYINTNNKKKWIEEILNYQKENDRVQIEIIDKKFDSNLVLENFENVFGEI